MVLKRNKSSWASGYPPYKGGRAEEDPIKINSSQAAEEQYEFISHKSLDVYLERVLDKFDIRARFEKPMCPVEQYMLAGQFADVDSKKVDINNVSVTLLDGIDQQGAARTSRSINRIFNALGFTSAAYIFNSTLKEAQQDYFSVLNNADFHSPRHEDHAQKVISSEKALTQGLNNVRYSNGCSFGRGSDRAIPRLLKHKGFTAEQIKDFFSKQRVLNFGVPPRWECGTEKVRGVNIGEYHSPEIGIYSTSDMFPFTSNLSRKIAADMELQRGELNQNFVVFHQPEDKNRVIIFIRSNVMVNKFNNEGRDIINIGGHRLQNYAATVGLIKHNNISVSTQGAQIGVIIKDFFTRDMDLSKTTLADIFAEKGFTVLPLDAKKYSYTPDQEDKVKRALVDVYKNQIRAEIVNDTHVLLGNVQNREVKL